MQHLLKYLGAPAAFALAILFAGTPNAPMTSVLPTVGGYAFATESSDEAGMIEYLTNCIQEGYSSITMGEKLGCLAFGGMVGLLVVGVLAGGSVIAVPAGAAAWAGLAGLAAGITFTSLCYCLVHWGYSWSS